eukprot:TRINITY_DN44179_c0_g1_i1.p1 TRINITY_DN44179_c0_g1~~TRINITY_DN44179_c0_g1_i1.p1  ORF type:complete len:605 (+),score=83.63 TRINITY_DN44179_c0_g1_i1:52-1815(+)
MRKPHRPNDSSEILESKPHGMFVDAAAMKQRIRESMMQPTYDVCNYYQTEGFCQRVARNPIFDNVTLSVIAFNALWMWVDTDLNDAPELLQAHPVFQTAEHFFCAYFSFEWCMRFGAFKRKRDGLKDAWFCFDTFMVSMMVAETWILTAVMAAASNGSAGGGLGNASMLRLLRLLRLSRMARMAKLLRSMPELLILVKGMVAAAHSVFFTLLLLFIAVYMFAIAFRQLTDGTPLGDKHFSTVLASMHTLFLDGTLLDGTGDLVRDLLRESWAYVLVLYVFVTLAALMVMNMLIGVLCEVVSAVAAAERDSISVATVKEGIMGIISRGGLDTDGDNQISKMEFNAILYDAEAVRLLNSVDVDTYGLVDLSDFIFSSDDDTQEEMQLSYEDFIDLILSLRGSNTATVKDVVDLRKFMQERLKRIEGKLDRLICPSPAAMPSTPRQRESTSSITTCCTEQGEDRTPKTGGPDRQGSLPCPVEPGVSAKAVSLRVLAERLDNAMASARLELDSFMAGFSIEALSVCRSQAGAHTGSSPKALQLQRNSPLPSTSLCEQDQPAPNLVVGGSGAFVLGLHSHPGGSSVNDDKGW